MAQLISNFFLLSSDVLCGRCLTVGLNALITQLDKECLIPTLLESSILNKFLLELCSHWGHSIRSFITYEAPPLDYEGLQAIFLYK